jgi:hypothetical protein
VLICLLELTKTQSTPDNRRLGVIFLLKFKMCDKVSFYRKVTPRCLIVCMVCVLIYWFVAKLMLFNILTILYTAYITTEPYHLEIENWWKKPMQSGRCFWTRTILFVKCFSNNFPTHAASNCHFLCSEYITKVDQSIWYFTKRCPKFKFKI